MESDDPEGSVPSDPPDGEIPADERDALLTIAHGAVVTSGGHSVQRTLTTSVEFVLTQGLGPVVYGVYSLVWRIAQLLLRFVNFGTVQTLQRDVPVYSDAPRRRRAVAGLAYATTVVVAVGIGIGLFVGADGIDAFTLGHPALPPAIRIFAVLVGLLGLVRIHAALLRATGSARGEVAFNRLLPPLVRLVGAAVAVALGYSVVGVGGAFVVGMAAVVLLGFPVVTASTGIRPTLRGSRAELRGFYDHAAPIAMSSVGKVFQDRIDILLVGVLLTASATGVYNVVLALVAIAWIPLRSFNQLLPPVASDLYADGRTDTLNAVYTSVTRLILTAVLPVLVIQVVFGRELLSVFGPTYVRGYAPLAVYLGGVLVGSAVGATGWLLMMTDHQYARMVLDWLLAGLNVLLTYAFVLEFGLVGAALGTGIAIAVQNSLQVLLLRHFEGLWPFDATFLKPLVAGATAGAVMLGVRRALGGLPAVGIGVVVGLVAYLAALRLLGVDDRDRLVVRTLSARYRRRIGALWS